VGVAHWLVHGGAKIKRKKEKQKNKGIVNSNPCSSQQAVRTDGIRLPLTGG